MSDNSWVLKGVDAETRERAVAEAERRGVSLAEYLTDVVLQAALAQQLGPPDGAPAEAQQEEMQPAPAHHPHENFVIRHRLDALERRVGLSVGGLDSAVHALDSSVFGLASRVDEAEALAAEAADLITQTAQQTDANLAALRKRLGDAEDQTGGLSDAHEALSAAVAERCDGLERHIGLVEDAARAANTSAAQLAVAHEALKYAVADDFSAFTRECTERLALGLEEVRASADAAAEHADAAVAHLIAELRSVREAVEARLQESVAETRRRMQTAFGDAAERMIALAERVGDCESATVRSAVQLRAQISDVEDGAQTALEETAEALRQAGAALAAEVARVAHDSRTALESVHGDLSQELGELRERHAGALARLKQLDAAQAGTAGELARLRQTLEARVADGDAALRTDLAQLHGDCDARFDAFAARLGANERDAAEFGFSMRAETERVEACAFAALEKIARDRAEGEARVETRLEQVGKRLDNDMRDVREQNISTLARLKLIEAAAAPLSERIGHVEAALREQGDVSGRIRELESAVAKGAADQSAREGLTALRGQSAQLADRIVQLEAEIAGRAIDRGFDERLLRLEAAAENEETAHALAALRGQVGALAARLDTQQPDEERLDELRTRVFACESQSGETDDRMHSVTRMLTRLTTQGADAAMKSEERLHTLELAVADMRRDAEASFGPLSPDLVQAIEHRVATLEQRQTKAFDMLSADIAHFISNNTRRLEALESGATAADGDLAAEFEALRLRVEDRILGVEQRSVRALEQVSDTMAVLEKRFIAESDAMARSA